MSRSALLSAMAGAVASFAVFSFWVFYGWGGPTVVGVVGDVGSVVAGGFAACGAAIAARRTTSRLRRAWVMLAAAVGCWVIGDILWALYSQVLRIEPFPSPADIGYLSFYLLACAALILLPSGASTHFQLRVILDGVIVAGSLFVISWSAGLDAVFSANQSSWLAFAISVAYPIADMILLTVAMLILSTAPTGQRAVLIAITGGLGLLAIADSAFVMLNAGGHYTSGGFVDIAWAAGLLLIGMAAMVGGYRGQHAFGSSGAPSRFALWMPYAPFIIATFCLVDSPASVPLLTAAMLVVVALAARQFVVADENRLLMESLAVQAHRDPLTGLANRALFRDHLLTALARHGEPRTALLSIDLDDFKSVNDSLGHVAGDALLTAVAQRLLQCAGPDDTVARLGGDEFAILLLTGMQSPEDLAERVFASFDDAFPIDGNQVLVRASIGIAVIDESTGSMTADALLNQADMAMYSAKRNGGGVRHFAAEMDRGESGSTRTVQFIAHRPRSTSAEFAAQLRHALDHGELGVVYQPQFEVATGEVAGVEALVRWHHPQRGMLRPDEFLPVARHNDLMGDLTDEVLRTAVRDVARWRATGVEIPFAVNLFPPSLGDPRLPEHLGAMLDAGGLAGDSLTVEITEDVLLANEPTAREVLHRLRGMGIRVSIDDFGSGYAGLNYLRQFPVDEVKLDRHLIAPMITDARAEAIVAAMIGLSHKLGLTCVAEGVEDAATIRHLELQRCDVMQGFFCGPPVPAADVLLSRYTSMVPPRRLLQPNPAAI